MKRRIYQYLTEQTDGASSREIAENVLKVQSAVDKVCQKLVQAAVEGDSHLTLDTDGLWRITPPESDDVSLPQATFTVVALLHAATRSAATQPIEISARRVKDGEIADHFDALIRPPSAILPEFVELTGITNDVLRRAKSPRAIMLSFFRFLGDSVIVLHTRYCPLSQVRHSSSEVLAALKHEAQKLSLDVKNRELFLHRLMRGLRLRRRGRSEAERPSLGSKTETDPGSLSYGIAESKVRSSSDPSDVQFDLMGDTLYDLAAALHIPHEEGRRAGSDADLAAEVLIIFLEIMVGHGVKTLEEALRLQHPEIEEIDFSKYAFDRDFLLQLPEQPGVYLMRDTEGRIVYVGKAKNLRDRVNSYFVNTADREDKIKNILDDVYDIEYEVAGSELAALLLEAKLILERQPKINRQIEIHHRPVSYGKGKNLILILPAELEDRIELFLVSKGHPPIQLEMSANQADPDYPNDLEAVKEAIRETYFGEEKTARRRTLFDDEEGELQVKEGDEAYPAMEILGSWLARNKDVVNYIVVDAAAGLDDVMRLLEDHIEDGGTDREKVYHI